MVTKQYPQLDYSTATPRDRYEYRDAIERYRIADCTAPRFGTYDLNRDGLNYPRSYGGSYVIDRIVRERSNEPYLLGVELEIEGADNRDAISSTLHRYLPKRHICVRDGSLDSSGIEIVTSPIAPREINRVAWYSLLRELRRLGCRSHDGARCGLHISVSRGYLLDRTWIQLRSWLTKHAVFFKSVSRREAYSYCQFVNRCDKYTALNLSKSAVAEFRFFRGTLKSESFLASVEIVRSLVEYAKIVEMRREQEGKQRSSFRVKGWIDLLRSRYPIASRYIGDRVELLKASENTRSGVPRRRYTDQDRRDQFVRQLRSIYIAHPSQWMDDGGIMLRSRWAYAENLSVVYSEQARSITLPVDWSRSSVPQSLRRLLDRGCGFSQISILTQWIPQGSASVSFHYRRGGWGNPSSIQVRVNSVRS